jgi:MFS family permease
MIRPYAGHYRAAGHDNEGDWHLPQAFLSSSGRAMLVVLGVATAIALAPVLVFPIAPLADYPNHLARMQVITTIGSDPDLARYYDIHWQIIPNLIMDVVVPQLARVTNIYHAGQAFTVLCMLLVATGVFALNRALFGGWPAIGLVGLPLLYNRIFLIGLMNYWFGVGLALWAVAAWVALRERWWPWRFLASALFAVGLFFSHILAVGVYGLALLAFELWRLRQRRKAPLAPRLVDFVATGLPFLPVLALLLASPTLELSGKNEWSWSAKLDGLHYVVSAYSDFADLALAAAMVAVLAWAAVLGRLRLHPAGWILLGLGALAYLAMPNVTHTAYLVDQRLPIAIILIAIGFTNLQAPARLAEAGIVLALLFLLAVRITEVGINWTALSRQEAQVLASTKLIAERGARVLVAQSDDTSDLDALDYGLAHAGCLAIIERSALVADTFVFAGKQIMSIRPAFQKLAESTDTELPSIDELKDNDASEELGGDPPYWQQWQDKFDYLYVMYTADDFSNPAPDVLTVVYIGDRFRLYKIRRTAQQQ